ncbi:hypothetical protein C8R43DRAFT_963900 [Mycena crocata]|nr:hypothetical protein C8R43DRAFT_963900 [Mycena crocata]
MPARRRPLRTTARAKILAAKGMHAQRSLHAAAKPRWARRDKAGGASDKAGWYAGECMHATHDPAAVDEVMSALRRRKETRRRLIALATRDWITHTATRTGTGGITRNVRDNAYDTDAFMVRRTLPRSESPAVGCAAMACSGRAERKELVRLRGKVLRFRVRTRPNIIRAKQSTQFELEAEPFYIECSRWQLRGKRNPKGVLSVLSRRCKRETGANRVQCTVQGTIGPLKSSRRDSRLGAVQQPTDLRSAPMQTMRSGGDQAQRTMRFAWDGWNVFGLGDVRSELIMKKDARMPPRSDVEDAVSQPAGMHRCRGDGDAQSNCGSN